MKKGRIKRIITSGFAMLLAGLLVGLFARCQDGIEVKQDYGFALSCWPLQSGIGNGETVEMRFTLHRQGNFLGASYRIGYMQTEGNGEVFDREQNRLENREMKSLEEIADLDITNPCKETFTLFYRSLSDKKTALTFIVADNFGQERTLAVSFDARSPEE